jgi:ribosomal protein S18 acetylase RimI-like enzyme
MTPSSSTTIRAASVTDIPALVQLINAAYAIETFFGGTRTDAKEVAELMQKGEFLVAQSASGSLLACVYTEVRGERGYFGMLSVEPSRQGSGLGRRMVEAAEDFCHSRGCRYVDISVLSLRPELLPLYHKLGYSETGTEAFHPPPSRRVGTECHLIIMTKLSS